MHKFPALNYSAMKLYGPCLEGVGLYPNVDVHMQVNDAPGVFAVGDTHGGLRGLIPSFLCGYYLANCLRFKEIDILLVSMNKNKHAEISAIVGPLRQIPIDSEKGLSVDKKVQTLARKFRQSDFFTPGKRLIVETTFLKIKNSDRCGDDYEEIGLERFLLETENAEATMTCYFSLIDGDSGTCLQETMGTRTGKICTRHLLC